MYRAFLLFLLAFQLNLSPEIFSLPIAHAEFREECPLNELKLVIPDAATPTEKLNSILVKKYPNLKFLVSDPDKFVAEMTDRFEKQKAITPDDPYQFDFSELGIPLVKDMNKTALERIEALKAQLAAGDVSASFRKEIGIDLNYLGDITQEMQGHLDAGKISYRSSIETSFFYNRAMGPFEARKQGLVLRFSLTTDRIANGYHPLSIAEDYELYKKRKFTLFVGKSPVVKAYRDAEPLLNTMLTDKNKLNGILLPTNEPLWLDIFFQWMPRKIYPLGVTDIPIQADGILRPPGDFWNHDVRHSSAMYLERLRYTKGLRDDQITKLNAKMDEWFVDFLKQVDEIQDPLLKKSVWLNAFNMHHERGFVFSSSAYLKDSPGFIPKALYGFMKVNKEIPDGESLPLQAGYKWLKKFWGPKNAEEQALLGRKLESPY